VPSAWPIRTETRSVAPNAAAETRSRRSAFSSRSSGWTSYCETSARVRQACIPAADRRPRSRIRLHLFRRPPRRARRIARESTGRAGLHPFSRNRSAAFLIRVAMSDRGSSDSMISIARPRAPIRAFPSSAVSLSTAATTATPRPVLEAPRVSIAPGRSARTDRRHSESRVDRADRLRSESVRSLISEIETNCGGECVHRRVDRSRVTDDEHAKDVADDGRAVAHRAATSGCDGRSLGCSSERGDWTAHSVTDRLQDIDRRTATIPRRSSADWLIIEAVSLSSA